MFGGKSDLSRKWPGQRDGLCLLLLISRGVAVSCIAHTFFKERSNPVMQTILWFTDAILLKTIQGVRRIKMRKQSNCGFHSDTEQKY